MKTVLVAIPIRRALMDYHFFGVLSQLAASPQIRVVVLSSVIPDLARIVASHDPNISLRPLQDVPKLSLTRAIYTSLDCRFPEVFRTKAKSVQHQRDKRRALP